MRAASAACSKDSKVAASWACPAVSPKCNGCPWPSQRKWIFVLKPPRERPMAWSAGSSASLFFRRKPHSEPLAPRSHRHTTSRPVARRRWSSSAVDRAPCRGFGPNSSDRTYPTPSPKGQIPTVSRARVLLCVAPRESRRAFLAGREALATLLWAGGTSRQSDPTLRRLNHDGLSVPLLVKDKLTNKAGSRRFRGSEKYDFSDRA